MRRCTVWGSQTRTRSEHRDDGLRLLAAYVTAVNRCAPPGNRPTPTERDNCLPYLVEEDAPARPRKRDRRTRVVRLGWFHSELSGELGHRIPRPKPRFGHATEAVVGRYSPDRAATTRRSRTPSRGDYIHRRCSTRCSLGPWSWPRSRSPRSRGAIPRAVWRNSSTPSVDVVDRHWAQVSTLKTDASLNLPNVLTLLRILAVPVIVVALLGETPNGDALAGGGVRAGCAHGRPRWLHRATPPGRDDVRKQFDLPFHPFNRPLRLLGSITCLPSTTGRRACCRFCRRGKSTMVTGNPNIGP